MTIAEVTYANLTSQSWQNVFDVVDDRSNVLDPVSGSGQKRKFVYNRDPDIKDVKFENFPYIVVNDPSLDEENNGKRTVDGKTTTFNWTFEIEVVTSERGFGNNEGRGSQHIKSITDDLVETFNNPSIRATFLANGMTVSRPRVTPTSLEELNNTLVWRRSVFVDFKSRKGVHA